MINPIKRDPLKQVFLEGVFVKWVFRLHQYMGVSIVMGVPLYRWMVLWENPSMDDNWVYPYFRKPQIIHFRLGFSIINQQFLG